MATNEKKAAEVCEERMTDIAALLDQIGQEIGMIRREYKEGDGLDWALAGSLGKARGDLIEALTSISALSTREIESTLTELRA